MSDEKYVTLTEALEWEKRVRAEMSEDGGTVTPEEAIAKLRAQEAAHQEADDILIVVLRTLAPDVAYEYEVLRLEKGFWYA